jgi:Na+/H+ antiporter NhaC
LTGILFRVQKIVTFQSFVDTWTQGVSNMSEIGLILVSSWSLAGVGYTLHCGDFLSQIFVTLPFQILPTLIFIVGAFLSLATGTSWGTMAILFPLAIPLAFSLNPDSNFLVICVSCVLSGAIVGDHASPISDTTITASLASG